MKDFADLTDTRMNEAAWRALDLMRAYAARDRAAVVEHLAPLEADQLEYAGGVLITMYNDARQVLNETGPPATRRPWCARSTRWRASGRPSTSSLSLPPPGAWPRRSEDAGGHGHYGGP
ncbi:hypothetical protein ACFWPP_01410 [Streptomyces anulatus]|uniref:hypothetical protein n=1 Tax=Streptomyces anulatus TaxID=1892 RepID=UPI00365D2FEE